MVRNGYTVHGFRSAFSDWAETARPIARDVIENGLAHIIKNKSEAAYRRGDALDKRGGLMDAWATLLRSAGQRHGNRAGDPQGRLTAWNSAGEPVPFDWEKTSTVTVRCWLDWAEIAADLSDSAA